MKARVLAAVALAVMVFGCPQPPGVDGGTGGGGSTGGGGGAAAGGGGGGLAIDSFCAAQQQANCAKQIRCGAAAPGTPCEKLVLPSRGSLINARLDCLPAALRANLASGLTHYDGVKATQCLSAIETSGACTSMFSNVPADPSCNEVFTGTVAAGGSCDGFNECGPGLYCDATINPSVCPGTCRPRVSAGGLAPGSLACELGLVGSAQSDGGLVCIPPVAPGQSCASASGFGTLICAGANSCQAADGGSTCQPLKSAGQPCSVFSFAECALDMTCAPGSDGGSQCIPWRRSGEACGVNLSCLMGLACVNGVCGPLVAEGGSCGSDLDCVAGRLCKAGSCQPLGGLDAGCDTRPFQGDCAVGLFCNAAARCETLRGLDATCSANECSMELGLTCALATDGGVSRCRPAFCAP